MAESRVKKTLLNMRINMVTYLGSIVISFFTRKVLLDHLGTEFLGLTTTLNSLLGFLNLAELGVGASIAYFLYKPLYDDDRNLVCETISIMGHLYRRIGQFILCAGILCSCFLPMMFEGTTFSWGIIYYCFYGQLFRSLLGYFVNYRAYTIFSADQRMYLVNAYFQLTQFAVVILQAVMAWLTGNYAIYVTISIAFGIVNSVILNWKFARVYPWVDCSPRQGKEALRRRPEVMAYVRRVFIHQFGGFVNNSALPLIVYANASLTMVTLYGNYSMLNGKLRDLVNSLLSGTEASVGNLVAEGDATKTYACYRELYSVKFLMVTLLTVCLWRYNSGFIAVWLGAEYVLPAGVVGLICLDLYLNLLRNTTDQYLNAFGLKADIWVPLCRIATLGVMVLTGRQWGLVGILAVPVAFQLTLTHIWKPYYLYRSGFHLSFVHYGRLLLANAAPLAVAYMGAVAIVGWLGTDCEGLPSTWPELLTGCASFGLAFLLLSFGFSWLVNADLRLSVQRRLLKRHLQPKH